MAIPFFLQVKLIFEIGLVICNKTTGMAGNLIHGIAFSSLVAVFICFTIKTRPYNYQRQNLWQVIGLL
jgi:hypothetical protein